MLGVLPVVLAFAATNCRDWRGSLPPGGHGGSGGAAAGSAGLTTEAGTGGDTERQGGQSGRGGATGTSSGGAGQSPATGGRGDAGGRSGRTGKSSGGTDPATTAGTGGDAPGPSAQGGATGTSSGGSTPNGAKGGTDDGLGGAAGNGGEAGSGAETPVLGCADEPVANGTFTPAALGARLVLWLDAQHAGAAKNGAHMPQWTDCSGAHNDGHQLTVADQPTYVSSATNGLPAMHFDGNLTFFKIEDSESLRWGTGPFAILAVVRGAPATQDDAMIYQKSMSNDPYPGPCLLVNSKTTGFTAKALVGLDADNYLLSTNDVQDRVPRLFVGRRYQTADGTFLELRENGAVNATTQLLSTLDVDAMGSAAIIGHNGYREHPGFQAYEGDISELCAVKGVLSDEELAGIEGYLMGKYGLGAQ
jgi:hypothetical protein